MLTMIFFFCFVQVVDSLINYETVKYFGNELMEARRLEASLLQQENATVRTNTSLAFLNWGQNVIFSLSLVISMALAAQVRWLTQIYQLKKTLKRIEFIAYLSRM